ncbi:heterodisulfide reductase [Methanocella sp. CWC-04]|uniref:Heterodisulfide reductase n=2 Tax=Methanooceanicella nereidis TaxID=2052831 RepID=A0AAP2RC94_9EURY|nr:heterodisulfide reductase [Methanocella sp. CWC-04]
MGKVPDNNYYLFKSCVAGSMYPGIEIAIRFVLDRIGVDYSDDPRHSSCTGFAYHTGVMPLSTNLALNARNFSLAAGDTNKNIVCSCPTSYGNLKECKDILSKDADLRDRTAGVLYKIGKDYDISPSVNHISEIFLARLDDITAKSVRSLSGIKAVTHHGCHYTKIFYRDVASGNFERPMVLDNIAKAFGCDIVEYGERSLCCGMGFHHTLTESEYPEEVLKRKFSSIRDAGPDVIITQCPGCIFNLDHYQESLAGSIGDIDIPVLYISELVALMLGAGPEEIGLDMHIVPVDGLLEKIGIKGTKK